MSELTVRRAGGLRDQLNMLNSQIGEVEKSLLLTTNPLDKVQYNLALGALKVSKAEVVRQLSAEPGERLGTALLRLDYVEQVETFLNRVTAKDPAAVRIVPAQGITDSVEDAVRLLLKRFLGIRATTPSAPFRMGFRSPVVSSSTEAMWRELGRSMGLPRGKSPSEVAAEVVARLTSQHVVIIVSDVDRIDIGECLTEIWEPLVRAVKTAAPEYKLILILVDLRSPPATGVASDAVRLVDVEVQRFPAEVVAAWLVDFVADLPDQLALQDKRELAATVVGDKRGPDEVLWAIYDLWECPGWELDGWLKT